MRAEMVPEEPTPSTSDVGATAPAPAALAPSDDYTLVFVIPPGLNIVERDLLRVIAEFGRKNIAGKPLEVLLNSTGGDTYSAYKIVHTIRNETDKVTIVVPLRAKSAATLMALSADTIVMGPQSDLGPLDLPMD